MKTVFDLVIRAAVVIFGIIIISEIAQPLSIEEMTVRRTTLRYQVDWPVIKDYAAKAYFSSGSIDSCQIGLRAYSKLKEQDRVRVALSHTLRRCITIHRNGEAIESGKFWKLISALLGALVICAGLFGKSRTDDDRYLD